MMMMMVDGDDGSFDVLDFLFRWRERERCCLDQNSQCRKMV
jgi:hypothetical protein